MAYMCADSGNLMAIAQQVIQQKQQQQQQQQQQQEHHHHHQQQQQQQQRQAQNHPSSSASPFLVPPPPWSTVPHHHDHFPFVLSDPTFSVVDDDDTDPFASDFHLSALAAPPPPPDFESDEWMESLIGDSSTAAESETWHAAAVSSDLPPLFAEGSDLNSVIFSSDAPIPIPPPLPLQTGLFDPKEKHRLPPDTTDASSSSSYPLLLKSLLDCARVADSDPDLASKSLIRVRELSSDVGDPTERLAFYFSEALHCRLDAALDTTPTPSPEELTLCYKSLNDACPYSKFAHLTANQAILEATEKADRIHIIDFGIVQGVQWAALLQALATRPEGKPSRIRISGIPASSLAGSPPSDLTAAGIRLRDFAVLLGLDFEFEPVLTPVGELVESDFRIEPEETVAVNFMLQLYNLLDESDSAAAVTRVVRLAKSLSPVVVTLGEYEISLNRAGFYERFNSALAYYSAVFESLEAGAGRETAEERVRVERVVFGHRILRAVGPEEGRVRMEERSRWTALMEGCGLSSLGVSNYAVSQAKLLLWNYSYSPKYTLLDSSAGGGFISLAWQDRPLLTVSSWR